MLLCKAVGETPPELEPQVVEQLVAGPWFALGSGNGLRVWITGKPPGARAGDDVRATVEARRLLTGY